MSRAPLRYLPFEAVPDAPAGGPAPDRREGRTGVRIVDDIENARFDLFADATARPRPTDGDALRFPVDVAFAVETRTLTLPKIAATIVRDATGVPVARSDNREAVSLPAGEYDVEVTTAPVKLYVAGEGSLAVRSAGTDTVLDFGETTTVRVGVRSFHERPAGTVTTTGDPETLMRAVSTLGSALTTASPERSFPTLRGHPPLFELGETFSAPSFLERPQTSVSVVVPPERRAVFAVAPLAYYLGADVVPGETPRLAGDGWSHSLSVPAPGSVDAMREPSPLERGVARTLRQTFFLDCLTRTEGLYPVDLHERGPVESSVDLDFGRLYDLPFSARLRAYLDVPFAELEAHLPNWSLTTDIDPTAENVEMLPFVANDLSLVRCPRHEAPEAAAAEPQAVTDFFRSAGTSGLVRGADSSSEETHSNIVSPDPTDTVEHAWVGDGYPLGANKATAQSYRRRIEREPKQRSSIGVTVVCNDEQMREEDVVADLYGLRDLLTFDIEAHYDLTRDQLVQVLETDTDFLHYIGHVDERGMQCSDGHLDVTATEFEAGADAFLLNACRSYEQGQALIDRGSYAGVVTLAEVENTLATEFGRTIARLLNCGFTLRSSLSIIRDQLMTAYRYTILGSGGMTLCHPDSGAPVLTRIESVSDDESVTVGIDYYPSETRGLGAISSPLLDDVSQYYLGSAGPFSLGFDELREFFQLELTPVRYENSLYWSDELDIDSLLTARQS
ncbi:caspase family protein [Halobium salinum]|uniref:Caspase family protein n=1 Tax=Halobium salinum TaxID=1364940 RepID=A0ABD5PC14_9EURY|nr:caspase family protein [Halobium salinum]